MTNTGVRHGWYGTPTHITWRAMLDRCSLPNKQNFRHYGGRGISVCPQWHEFVGFLQDMGKRPEGSYLDRIDSNGNYEPGNCRWATMQENNSNRRGCIYVEYKGEKVTFMEACRRLGLNYRTTIRRVTKFGWNVEDALSIPIGQRRPM